MNHYLLGLIFLAIGCGGVPNPEPSLSDPAGATPIMLDNSEATRLASLPLQCMDQQYPYKLGQTLGGPQDLDIPANLHPAFYGCFDWHSAVHGHWSLVVLLKQFPALEQAESIREKLKASLSAEHILGEVKYFQGKHNQTFERTYGWAWVLKLGEEIHRWDDPLARQLERNLQPLMDLIVEKYLQFLPKLLYPIRSGTHPNTAFGLSFAYDYAHTMEIDTLKNLIGTRARDYYQKDTACPMDWEPSGSDFLSPCLEEADIMRRILEPDEFMDWLGIFLPELMDPGFQLDPAIVSDRTDGQLVHLDGLNFSRAWCLYGLASTMSSLDHLVPLAADHIAHSLGYVTDGNYEGGHWLATFAILALNSRADLSM
ncbi:MAG: DUF2891 domain-containing protein [Saprospiraceae bacterium]|nr:DUF2891 domain-containing protein [Saprospiraceae bacterium]